MHCTITAIHGYPVKSCRGSALDRAEFTPTGVTGDRRLMIVRDGAFVNQARLPGLARVAPTRIDDGTIAFSRTDGAEHAHAVTGDGEQFALEYYGCPVTVVDQGDAVARFVSEEVGADVRVVALQAPFTRHVPLEEFALVDGTSQTRFTDIAPVLVTNEATLDDLNGRLASPVPMDRFRPNVVVSGLDAFEEDDLTALAGGGLRLLRATYCERCAVTCTDQQTGERSKEPLATLKSYRHRENGFAGGVLFGAYMAVEGSGTLAVGDRLTVERGAP